MLRPAEGRGGGKKDSCFAVGEKIERFTTLGRGEEGVHPSGKNRGKRRSAHLTKLIKSKQRCSDTIEKGEKREKKRPI